MSREGERDGPTQEGTTSKKHLGTERWIDGPIGKQIDHRQIMDRSKVGWQIERLESSRQRKCDGQDLLDKIEQ